MSILPSDPTFTLLFAGAGAFVLIPALSIASVAQRIQNSNTAENESGPSVNTPTDNRLIDRRVTDLRQRYIDGDIDELEFEQHVEEILTDDVLTGDFGAEAEVDGDFGEDTEAEFEYRMYTNEHRSCSRSEKN